MHHTFRELEGFEERHSHDEPEACAAALFLAHQDLDSYDRLRRDIRDREGS